METVGAVVIRTEEYRKLVEKSLKYDLLYEMAKESTYLTDRERLVFGIKQAEEK